jgi:hypothetical protein
MMMRRRGEGAMRRLAPRHRVVDAGTLPSFPDYGMVHD